MTDSFVSPFDSSPFSTVFVDRDEVDLIPEYMADRSTACEGPACLCVFLWWNTAALVSVVQ